eukprot:403372187
METNRTKIFPLHSSSNNNVYIDFQSTHRFSTKDEDPFIIDKKVSLQSPEKIDILNFNKNNHADKVNRLNSNNQVPFFDRINSNNNLNILNFSTSNNTKNEAANSQIQVQFNYKHLKNAQNKVAPLQTEKVDKQYSVKRNLVKSSKFLSKDIGSYEERSLFQHQYSNSQDPDNLPLMRSTTDTKRKFEENNMNTDEPLMTDRGRRMHENIKKNQYLNQNSYNKQQSNASSYRELMATKNNGPQLQHQYTQSFTKKLNHGHHIDSDRKRKGQQSQNIDFFNILKQGAFSFVDLSSPTKLGGNRDSSNSFIKRQGQIVNINETLISSAKNKQIRRNQSFGEILRQSTKSKFFSQSPRLNSRQLQTRKKLERAKTFMIQKKPVIVDKEMTIQELKELMLKDYELEKRRKKKKDLQNQIKINQNDDAENISSDDCKENQSFFRVMDLDEREEHMIKLWRQAYLKGRAGARVITFFNDLSRKIYLFGVSKNLEEIQNADKIPSYILIGSKWIIDVLFMVDIVVTFFTAFEDQHGVYHFRLKQIGLTYIKGWFFLDCIACFPFQLLTVGGSNYQKLLRLMRLPKLYRSLKIMKILEAMTFLEENRKYKKFMNLLKMNSAIVRLVQGMISALILTHLFGCFWFLSSKFNDHDPDTWIARLKLEDADDTTQYLYSLYWSTQTVITVGYGDLPAITSNIEVQASIQLKIKSLIDLAKKATIPYVLSKKIKRFIENNFQALHNQDEEGQLIKMLPPSLRDEVLSNTYGEIIEKVKFFREIDDPDFQWKVLPLLREVKLEKGDILYWRGDHAEDIYFILQGVIRMYTEKGYPYLKLDAGDLFGDSDSLLNLPRDGKAIAATHVKLMVLKVENIFDKNMENQEINFMRMIFSARRKRDEFKKLIIIANKRAKLHQNILRKKKKDFKSSIKSNEMQNINPEQRPLHESGRSGTIISNAVGNWMNSIKNMVQTKEKYKSRETMITTDAKVSDIASIDANQNNLFVDDRRNFPKLRKQSFQIKRKNNAGSGSMNNFINSTRGDNDQNNSTKIDIKLVKMDRDQPIYGTNDLKRISNLDVSSQSMMTNQYFADEQVTTQNQSPDQPQKLDNELKNIALAVPDIPSKQIVIPMRNEKLSYVEKVLKSAFKGENIVEIFEKYPYLKELTLDYEGLRLQAMKPKYQSKIMSSMNTSRAISRNPTQNLDQSHTHRSCRSSLKSNYNYQYNLLEPRTPTVRLNESNKLLNNTSSSNNLSPDRMLHHHRSLNRNEFKNLLEPLSPIQSNGKTLYHNINTLSPMPHKEILNIKIEPASPMADNQNSYNQLVQKQGPQNSTMNIQENSFRLAHNENEMITMMSNSSVLTFKTKQKRTNSVNLKSSISRRPSYMLAKNNSFVVAQVTGENQQYQTLKHDNPQSQPIHLQFQVNNYKGLNQMSSISTFSEAVQSFQQSKSRENFEETEQDERIKFLDEEILQNQERGNLQISDGGDSTFNKMREQLMIKIRDNYHQTISKDQLLFYSSEHQKPPESARYRNQITDYTNTESKVESVPQLSSQGTNDQQLEQKRWRKNSRQTQNSQKQVKKEQEKEKIKEFNIFRGNSKNQEESSTKQSRRNTKKSLKQDKTPPQQQFSQKSAYFGTLSKQHQSQTASDLAFSKVKISVEDIEFRGDPAVEQMLQFNVDMNNISLNIFETFTLFDMYKQSARGLGEHVQNIWSQKQIVQQRQNNMEAKLQSIENQLDKIKSLQSDIKKIAPINDNSNQYLKPIANSYQQTPGRNYLINYGSNMAVLSDLSKVQELKY